MKIKKIFLSAFVKYGAIVLAVAVIGGFWYSRSGTTEEEMMVVHPADFVQDVSVSGKVTATENFNLSFEQGGRVTAVMVRVGDRVSAGQVLVSQDTGELNARLAEMQAGIEVQKARLAQLLAGASQEEIAVSQTSVVNAESSLASARATLGNAHQSMINTLNDAYTKADDAVFSKADQMFSNPQSNNPRLGFSLSDSQLKTDLDSGRFFMGSVLKRLKTLLDGMTQASNLTIYVEDTKANLGDVKSFLDKLSRAVNDPNSCSVNSQQSCEPVSSAWKSDVSTARTNINTALAAITSAEGSLKTAQSGVTSAEGALQTARDQLVLKKAPARSSDIALKQAEIRQAEASRLNIAAQLAKKQIRSPIGGVVTAVPVKMGSTIAANETSVSLISTGTLQIESYVPEIHLPLLNVGDEAAVTLDAYGINTPFASRVISIDPAETVRDGVPTYRIKLQFSERDDRVKPGMTANVVIVTERKSGVFAVPQNIVVARGGKKFIMVKEGDRTVERQVEIGSVSSLGKIEIVSGLTDGDMVILKETEE